MAISSLRTSILDILPLDLLLMVKDSIPKSDLRTHVCFHDSFPLVRSRLYGTKQRQQAFWQTACMLSGVGMIKEEECPDDVDWREVALRQEVRVL